MGMRIDQAGMQQLVIRLHYCGISRCGQAGRAHGFDLAILDQNVQKLGFGVSVGQHQAPADDGIR